MEEVPGLNSLLERIVAQKRFEVAALPELEAPTASGGRFRAGLLASPRKPALIAEVKKKSPSHGTVWEHFDPVAIALAYERAGASALSVLTDAEFFGGSLADLKAVKQAVGLPILRKDFVIDAKQVHEAAIAGADAVLLIVRLLDQPELADLLATAERVGLDALVEVHTEEEAAYAVEAGATLIGVNHRDLDTLKIDLGLTERVIPLLPKGTLRVSESGLSSPADIRMVQSFGADAVLIGAAFGTADAIESRLTEVMGWA